MCYTPKRPLGYTLVEVLVSAVIMSLALIAIVTVIRKSWDINVDNLHRRQARTIIINHLELLDYHHSNFSSLCTSCCTNDCNKTETVTIDKNLTGTLNTSIIPNNSLSIDGTIIPLLIVTIKLTWQEAEYPDSVSVEKWVAQVL